MSTKVGQSPVLLELTVRLVSEGLGVENMDAVCFNLRTSIFVAMCLPGFFCEATAGGKH